MRRVIPTLMLSMLLLSPSTAAAQTGATDVQYTPSCPESADATCLDSVADVPKTFAPPAAVGADAANSAFSGASESPTSGSSPPAGATYTGPAMKTLPDTGGLPFALPAGALLLCGGAALLCKSR